MKRADLVDLLRRSKPVFSEAPKMKYKESLKTIMDGFEKGYESSDAVDVFIDMAKVAGLI